MEIVLNSYGTSLSCENEAFIVRNCNGSQRIPTDGVTAILINKGASMTSDAVMLAVDRQIQIHFMDRKGTPIGLVWSYKYGSVSTIRKNQIDFCNSQQGLLWIKSVIQRKIENEQAMLYMVDIEDAATKRRIDGAIAKLDNFLRQLRGMDSATTVLEVAPEIRGIEGIAAARSAGVYQIRVRTRRQGQRRYRTPRRRLLRHRRFCRRTRQESLSRR